jgi:hypothetical protein
LINDGLIFFFQCKKLFMAGLAQTPEQSAQFLELMEARVARVMYTVQELRVPSLLHFVYKVRLATIMQFEALSTSISEYTSKLLLTSKTDVLPDRIASGVSSRRLR